MTKNGFNLLRQEYYLYEQNKRNPEYFILNINYNNGLSDHYINSDRIFSFLNDTNSISHIKSISLRNLIHINTDNNKDECTIAPISKTYY